MPFVDLILLTLTLRPVPDFCRLYSMCLVGAVDDPKGSVVWMGELDRQFLAEARHVVPVPGGIGDPAAHRSRFHREHTV
jgi:hypothetical protein